jgi:tetratricopeptide (TPR) repeat protein
MAHLATAYSSRMNLAEAEGLLGKALGIRQALGANRDAETATALNNLGETFRSQGLPSQAEQQFRQSIRIWEEAAGADHLETAISLNNLAGALQDQQRYR